MTAAGVSARKPPEGAVRFKFAFVLAVLVPPMRRSVSKPDVGVRSPVNDGDVVPVLLVAPSNGLLVTMSLYSAIDTVPVVAGLNETVAEVSAAPAETL